jgi:hypothetical protein
MGMSNSVVNDNDQHNEMSTSDQTILINRVYDRKKVYAHISDTFILYGGTSPVIAGIQGSSYFNSLNLAEDHDIGEVDILH